MVSGVCCLRRSRWDAASCRLRWENVVYTTEMTTASVVRHPFTPRCCWRRPPTLQPSPLCHSNCRFSSMLTARVGQKRKSVTLFHGRVSLSVIVIMSVIVSGCPIHSSLIELNLKCIDGMIIWSNSWNQWMNSSIFEWLNGSSRASQQFSKLINIYVIL